METKPCRVCGIEKPLECYYNRQRKSRGKALGPRYDHRCITCTGVYEREWYANNKDHVRKRGRKFKYNLDDEGFEALLESQGGVCPICLNPNPTHVDHDHSCCPQKTQSCGLCVRGILCNDCNSALGFLKDDIASFERAIGYLRESV